mgnify:FL=1
MGHACAVGDRVVTAHHVMVQNQDHAYWSNEQEQHGEAESSVVDLFRDFVTITLTNGEWVRYLPLAHTVEVGEKVRWIQFNQKNENVAMQPEVIESEVIMILGGHLILKDPPTPGASGSCVVNAANEVVGLAVWGMAMQNAKGIAGVVDLTKGFAKL